MNTVFQTLVIHFFKRFFERESRSADSDAYTGVLQTLALLATPGLGLSFYMGAGDWRNPDAVAGMWSRVGDHYVYICYSMVVMGLLMTLKWDMLFPDRRDYLILWPLPIRPRSLFMAKVVALAGYLALFAIAINICTMIVVPLAYPNPSHLWSWTLAAFRAHSAGVLGASLFTALFFASFQGVLINLVNPSTFRRISPRIQMISIALLVVVFLTLPLFKQSIRPLSERYPNVLGWFPFIWFLGRYESLLPDSTVMAAAQMWGRMASWALLAVSGLCVLSYFAGYKRYSKKILESIDSDALPPGLWQRCCAAVLNRTVLNEPAQRATFYFIGQIAARSPMHRIVTALYSGAGIALAVSFAFVVDPKSSNLLPFRLSPQGALDAPIMLTVLLISGLRATFNLPYEAGANWIFQVIAGRSVDYLKSVRKWVFICRIIPLYGLLAVLEFSFFDPWRATAHLAFDLLLSAILVECFFLNFNKVPFTCLYPRDRFRLAALAVGYFYGFVIYVGITGSLKRFASSGALACVAVLLFEIALLAVVMAIRRWTRDRFARVVYQESAGSLLSIAEDAGYWQPRRRWTSLLGDSDLRDLLTWERLEQVGQDLRFGSRILWKSPAISLTAIGLIALVIGGNTAIYSMVHALLVKPAPGVNSENLVAIGQRNGSGEFLHSYPDYLDYSSRSRTLQPLVAMEFERFALGWSQGTFGYLGAAVTAEYFDTLGVGLVRGRGFSSGGKSGEEDLPVVISYRVWEEQFQKSETALGREVTINNQPAIITGVAPPHFQGPFLGNPDDLWVPLVSYVRRQGREQLLNNRARLSVAMLGRLDPRQSLTRAQAEMSTIARSLDASYPESASQRFAGETRRGRGVWLFPYSATAFGGIQVAGPRFLAIFSVVTLLTLIIVCANVANLLLARSLTRQRETAVRQSIGASRMRILRMQLAEGWTLSLAAWGAGCLFAFWLSKVIVRLIPPELSTPLGMRVNHGNMDFAPDFRVMSYAMGLAVIGTVAFTIAPALRSWRQSVLPFLKAGEHSVAPGRTRLSSALVVAQIAFSVVLLTSAGLAYRSLGIIDTTDLHFDSGNLLVVTLNPTNAVAGREVQLTLLESLRDRLRKVHGVRAVSYMRLAPPYVWGHESVRATASGPVAQATSNFLGPEYLKTLGLAPIAGREFTAEDRGARRSVLINRNLAATLWPGLPAVGHALMLGASPAQFQVIGVTPDAYFNGVSSDSSPNFIFFAEQEDPAQPGADFTLHGSGDINFCIRYSGTLDAVAPEISAAIREVNTRVPVTFIRTMQQQLDSTSFATRVITTLLVCFSLISLTIAAIGQYAVIAFDMRRRKRELGLRAALGASSGQIVGEVMREGLALTVAGLGCGFALSLAAGIALHGLLYGVTMTDARTYAIVFAILAAASLLACYLPARRASRMDPLSVLRYE